MAPSTPFRRASPQLLILTRALGRLSQAQRTHDDAVAIHGATSPQATAAASALETASQNALAAHALAQRASVVAPEVAAEAFAVYGRAVGPDGIGMAGVRVRAESETQQLIGETTTDPVGAFVIRMPASGVATTPASPPSPPKEQPSGATTTKPADATTPAPAPEAHVVVPKGVFLSVLGADGSVLYRDQTSTAMAAGQAERRELAVKTLPTKA